MPEPEWVEIVHPALPSESQSPGGGRAVVTAEAFDEVWSELGWTVAEPEEPTPPPPPVPTEQPAYTAVPTDQAPADTTAATDEQPDEQPEAAPEQSADESTSTDEPIPARKSSRKGK